MAPLHPVLLLALLLAAPAVGSFLATAALRLPQGAPLLLSRSACPSCGHPLAWRDLLPLVSWLLSGARCRYCSGPVALFYPLAELAALAAALAGLLLVPGWLAVATLLLGWTLLALALIDLRSLCLPDAVTLPLGVAGLAFAAVLGRPLWMHLLGMAVGFLLLAAVAWTYRRWRGREGLGLGDAKLFAAAGAWLGFEALPGVLLLAALVTLAAALLRGLGPGSPSARRLPFGPGLAFAFYLAWLLGPLSFG